MGRMLDGGEPGRLAAGRHVMSVYAQPLQAYLQGSSFRTLGDPEEVVQSFFADRLSRDGFLDDWWRSGHRFRYWLIRAFRNFLLEQRRADKRWRRAPEVGSRVVREPEPDEPDSVFHREVALSIVRAACREAEHECVEHGLDAHWRAFVRHHLDGLDYRDVGEELGVSPARASVMARTAAGRFRTCLRASIAWKGASEPELGAEIEELLEALRP